MAPPADPAPTILALDLGTSAVKAALVDLADGRFLAAASAPLTTRALPGGGVEQDPAEWLAAARRAITVCLAAAPARPAPLALGLTGQMQDLVLLGDDPASALAPAILYTDTRAATDAEAIRAALPDWDRLAGNRQDATSSAAAIRRLQRLHPELLARTRRLVLGPAGFIARALGADARCDTTTASTTGLLDLGTGTWSPDVLRTLGLPERILPRLTTGGEPVARTTATAKHLLGLPAGIPVVLAPGDAAATTLGTAGLELGADHAYLGTSGWIARVVPAASADGATASHRLALSDPAAHLHISAVLAAGAAAAWAREAFLGGASPAQADRRLEERSRTRGRGPSGLLALPSIHGERFPVRDADLRAAVIGMDAGTRGIDVYAAVLEGVAHALGHALGDTPDTGRPLPVAGGGAASAPWLRILADVTGRPILPLGAGPDAEDAALAGAAIAAADGAGLAHGIRPLVARGGRSRPILPDTDAAAAHRRERARHRALYDALASLPAGMSTKQ